MPKLYACTRVFQSQVEHRLRFRPPCRRTTPESPCGTRSGSGGHPPPNSPRTASRGNLHVLQDDPPPTHPMKPGSSHVERAGGARASTISRLTPSRPRTRAAHISVVAALRVMHEQLRPRSEHSPNPSAERASAQTQAPSRTPAPSARESQSPARRRCLESQRRFCSSLPASDTNKRPPERPTRRTAPTAGPAPSCSYTTAASVSELPLPPYSSAASIPSHPISDAFCQMSAEKPVSDSSNSSSVSLRAFAPP